MTLIWVWALGRVCLVIVAASLDIGLLPEPGRLPRRWLVLFTGLWLCHTIGLYHSHSPVSRG